MANIHRGEVEILLDRPRKLKYTTNSLAELESKLGYSISDISKNNKAFVQTLIKVVWAGLIHESPELTLRDTADIMDYAEDYEYINEKITEAMELKFQTKKNSSKKSTKKDKSSSGKS